MMEEDSSPSTVEIPLVFPSLEESPRLYVVNDADKTIQAVQREFEDTTNGDSSYVENESALWRGSASVSSLRDGSGVPDAVLTTSFLTERPSILSVALLWTTENSLSNSAPILMQIDLGSQTSKFRSPVKVQAFYWNEDDEETTIGLIIVDSSATLLRIRLDALTLTPVEENILVFNAAENLATKVDSPLAPPNLRSSMVVGLSATSVLMALNPFLVEVDLEEETNTWLYQLLHTSGKKLRKTGLTWLDTVATLSLAPSMEM
jgi:hypothetical protein